MALVVLQPGLNPLGQFDGYDSQVTSFKGGEICTWRAVSVTGTDKAAKDAFDGYDNSSTQNRPTVSFTLVSGSRPLFLADDGTSGYGTLFGSVVGATAGQIVSGGTALGPHTAAGSGKITLWDKQGLYAVTLDAADTASDGIVKTNASLTVGHALTYTATGQLTPTGSGAAVGGAPTVGYFAELQSNGSLVTTPVSLTEVGTGAAQQGLTMAVFFYVGAA